MNSEIKKLEKELEALKLDNRVLWKTYGSELCSAELIHKEEILEAKIAKLKEKEEYKDEVPFYSEDPTQIVDN